MSLKQKFKTSSDAARDGVWVDYPSQPNADGTVPGFKLARMSRQNKKYQLALRAVLEAQGGDVESAVADDAVLEKALLRAFIDTILLDWRNFQPDDDGVALLYSKETAEAVFINPDWIDLFGDLTDKAARNATFREKALEAQAKNS